MSSAGGAGNGAERRKKKTLGEATERKEVLQADPTVAPPNNGAGPQQQQQGGNGGGNRRWETVNPCSSGRSGSQTTSRSKSRAASGSRASSRHRNSSSYRASSKSRNESTGGREIAEKKVGWTNREIGNSGNLFVMSAYCRPSQRQYEFDRIVSQAKGLAGTRPLLILGDFNAPHTTWGYKFQSKRGKSLAKAMEDHEMALLNEPDVPTRRGNSAARDTTPDLSWLSGTLDVTWRSEEADLGSDHSVIRITIRGSRYRAVLGTARITDWDKMRKYTQEQDAAAEEEPAQAERKQTYTEWARDQKQALQKFTQEIARTAEVPYGDARLTHMWAARHSLTRRWKRQRHNRKLAKRIVVLNKQIAEHTAKLCRKNWLKTCDDLQGKLSARKTWCLLRHLIDPLSTKTATNRNLTKVLNTYKGDGCTLLEDLKARYLNEEKGQYPVPETYEGPDNDELDRPFTMTEFWTAIDESNKRSAPGRDAITYKLLGNMSGAAARGLLEHINETWDSSRLPEEWKEAEVHFIPKPGKALTIDNMRPISLTSCAGKVMKRMVLRRLQKHLEETDQMPETMYGFRHHLSTQDVMVQLHELVVKQATRHAPRGILALDLKGACDNVSHASVLQNLNKTRCGRKTFGYIKDFLSNRTATIRIGDEKSDPVELGDRGTPHGALRWVLLHWPAPPRGSAGPF
ncbi:uncharacterized protein LOC144166425 [Haemaphysalis longicornis]